MSAIIKYIISVVVVLFCAASFVVIVDACERQNNKTSAHITPEYEEINQEESLVAEAERVQKEIEDDKASSEVESDDSQDEEVPTSDAEEAPTSEDSEDRLMDEPVTPRASKDYMVLSGSYLLETRAQEKIRIVRSKGYGDAEMVVFDLSQYYTVRINSFDDYDSAKAVVNELSSKHGIKSYVLKKR